MPSGSHGGGGGSHFGGSFGGGGSHFGRSSQSSGTSVHRNVIIFWGGRRYSYSDKSSGKLRTFFALFILFLCFALISGLIWGGSCGNLDKIESDYKYYQNMIARAEEDSNYLTTGIITDHFKNEDCGKWYFTYELTTFDGQKLEGYTFSIYTLEELESWPVDKVIDIAVSSKTITLKTDSVPMNYKDVALDKDGEYANTVRTIKVTRVTTIVLGVTSVIFLASLIAIAVKEKDLKPETKEQTETKVETKPETKNYWVCGYCGNKNKLDDFNCSHCGAKKE